MKFKIDFFLLMMIVIIASVAAVNAVDLNENATADINDEFQLEEYSITLEEDYMNSSAEITQEENLSDFESESALELTTDSTLESDGESESPLYGIVDLGSNTMELTIYKIKKSGKPKSVFSVSEKSVTSTYVENNNLTQEGINKLVSILEDFDEIMDIVNVKTKYVFATASLRKIGNTEEVIAAVKKETGIDINLISGEMESIAGFNAIRDNDLTTDDGIVIDLGGGSCEVTDFVNRTSITSESMPIGSNSIYKDYVNGTFPDETEALMIKNRVLSELGKLSISNNTQRDDLFGTGGTVKTIKKVLVYLGELDDDATYIPVSMLDSLLERFSQPSQENFDIILNVNADRLNTFVPGMIITKTILEYFNCSYLHFCKNGVRDGILAEIIANESQNNKQQIILNVSDIDIAADENAEITVKLEENASGTVSVEINKTVYKSDVKNGIANVILPKLKSGNYTAKVKYGGDANYLSDSTKIRIHVKAASLDASDMTRGWASDYDYQAKLIDEAGNGISNKLITFNVNGTEYYAITDSDGYAKLKANLNAGYYEVAVSSDIAENTTKKLKIIKRIQNNTDLTVYYADNANYTARIIADDGAGEIAGKAVDAVIDNVSKTLMTDENGFITVTLDENCKPGMHTIKISYNGDSVENKVTVKGLITLKTVKVKKSAKKLVLKAALKRDSAVLKNKMVRFKFNGKTFKAKTNSKGIAKVTVKSSLLKKLKAGKKVTYSASYLKDSVKKTVKIKK